MYQVTASIVLYNPDQNVYKAIESFFKVTSLKIFLYLIDNSPTNEFENKNADLLLNNKIKYIFVNKNVGYGAGHNMALKETIDKSEFHVILNPDVYFNEGVIESLYIYAKKNPDIGHVLPKVLYPSGDLQFTCKLIPAPLDLIARLIPVQFFKKRNEKFELRFTGYDKIMEVPYLSGCFMFLRCAALKEIGLFDERFFMYPEDIDMTRRISRKFKTIFYPFVHIYHAHAKSSFKKKRMFFIHMKNMVKYFNKWGWLFDIERVKKNKTVLQQLKQNKQ